VARAQPWWVGWRLVALVIVAVHVAGTLGYVLIEGWTLWDAFYMTVITITTVGYGEVHPLSRLGQAFTVVILLTGVGAFFYAFTLIMALLAEGTFLERRERRRLARMLDDLNDHFILCGYGRMGEIISREFARHRVPFVVIERNPDRMHLAMDAGFICVEADASSEEVLRRVHIERARGLVAAVSTDAENVYAVLSARLLKPDLFIVGRAETDDARAKLKRAGADRVISPYHLGGVQLAQTALRPAVVDFVQLATSSDNMDLSFEQVHIGERSSLAGKNLLDAELRQRFGVVVVSIRRVSGKMEFNPEPDTVICAGDDLVVLGRAASLKELETAAGGRNGPRERATS
jgi:voltage-gated potassium channel